MRKVFHNKLSFMGAGFLILFVLRFANKNNGIEALTGNCSRVFVCLFLLLYVPCQQLWSLRDGQFT